MRTIPVSPIRSMTLLAVGIAACGGGDGSTGTAGIDGTGLQPVASVGAIEGFGSVRVNGVSFDTSDATITLDGEVSIQSDLALGDVVLVQGTIDEDGATGTADSVDFDDIVEGPISSINLTTNSFVVLGQIVRVVAETSFDAAIQPPELATLSVDDIVEVSGFVNSNGNISATSIQRKPELVELELTGTVSNDSPALEPRFNINAQVVNYSTALIEGFPDGFISNGDLVEVKGNVIDAAGDLIATRVIFKGDEFGATQGLLVFLDGFITRFTSATDFDVSGFPVTTNDQTVFEFGTTAEDLSLNSNVEIQGEIDASGVLVAEFINLRPFSPLGNVFFEPFDFLDGAGLLTSQSDFFADYASRSSLPGCDNPDIPFGEFDNGEWFVGLDREIVDGALVQTARWSKRRVAPI